MKRVIVLCFAVLFSGIGLASPDMCLKVNTASYDSISLDGDSLLISASPENMPLYFSNVDARFSFDLEGSSLSAGFSARDEIQVEYYWEKSIYFFTDTDQVYGPNSNNHSITAYEWDQSNGHLWEGSFVSSNGRQIDLSVVACSDIPAHKLVIGGSDGHGWKNASQEALSQLRINDQQYFQRRARYSQEELVIKIQASSL